MLLALARTQKVDLAKISMLALADQYLGFIAEAQKLRLELAADYLVMAAWLAFLKSQLLLPREAGTEDQPSGEELAARLAFRLKRLEAMRNAAAQLMTRKRLGRDMFARGMPEGVRTIRERQYTAVIYDLLKAYAEQRRRTIKRVHVVPRRTVWSIKEARQRLERWSASAVGRASGCARQIPGAVSAQPRRRPHGGGQLVRRDAGDGARGPGRDLAGRAVRAHLHAQARGRRRVAARVAASVVLIVGETVCVRSSLQRRRGQEWFRRSSRGAAIERRQSRTTTRRDDAGRRASEAPAHEAGAACRQHRRAAVRRPARAAAHPRGAAVCRLRAAGRAISAHAPEAETTSARC